MLPAHHNQERFMSRYSDGTVSVWRNCTVTKEVYLVEVKQEDFDAWQKGKLAQDAFPYLTSNQREFLISNSTPKEWDQLFSNIVASWKSK